MASESKMQIQDEKEALLNNRIEEIRRKNAALQKRYEEVQADKKNADVVEGRGPPSTSSRPPREINVRQRQHLPAAQRLGSRVKDEATVANPRPQRLKEEDGPPPDPSYSFLADRTRDREEDEEEQQQQTTDRRQGSRRHMGNFGGKDFSNAKNEMQKKRSNERNAFPRRSTNSKMEMELSMTGRERRDYEHWRSERKGIDEARVSRQRTTSGEWGRQWDKEKNFNKDVTTEATSAANSQDKKQESSKKSPNFHDSRRGRGSISGHPHRRPYQREEIVTTNTEVKLWQRRSVEATNDTLNISIENELATLSSQATETSDDVMDSRAPESSPPPPPIPPRANRRWGSDDAWEDGSPWEECEEQPEELVDDTFEYPSSKDDNEERKLKIESGNQPARDDDFVELTPSPSMITSNDRVDGTSGRPEVENLITSDDAYKEPELDLPSAASAEILVSAERPFPDVVFVAADDSLVSTAENQIEIDANEGGNEESL